VTSITFHSIDKEELVAAGVVVCHLQGVGGLDANVGMSVAVSTLKPFMLSWQTTSSSSWDDLLVCESAIAGHSGR
jgi:hypothetical protein